MKIDRVAHRISKATTPATGEVFEINTLIDAYAVAFTRDIVAARLHPNSTVAVSVSLLRLATQIGIAMSSTVDDPILN